MVPLVLVLLDISSVSVLFCYGKCTIQNIKTYLFTSTYCLLINLCTLSSIMSESEMVIFIAQPVRA